MDLTIRLITEADYQRVHAFQWEYLDQEDFEVFAQRVKANPDLYLVAFDRDFLVAICYGQPFRKDPSYICLQGFAVCLEEGRGYARKGIGSMLLKRFEAQVQKKDYHRISLGSADDKRVEAFYLKNGYSPVELVAKGRNGEELERVSISDYDAGVSIKQALKEKHHAHEVIFIFDKILAM